MLLVLLVLFSPAPAPAPSPVDDREPSTVTKEEPENNTCTRCKPFISNVPTVDGGDVVVVVDDEEADEEDVADDDDDDDDDDEAAAGVSNPRASFICGTLSPVRLASLTTAAPLRSRQSQGIVSLRVVPLLETLLLLPEIGKKIERDSSEYIIRMIVVSIYHGMGEGKGDVVTACGATIRDTTAIT